MPVRFLVSDDLPRPNGFESLPEQRAWGRIAYRVTRGLQGFRGRATAVVDGIAVDVQEAWGRRAWVCDQEEAATEGGRAGRPRLACAVDVSELDDVVMSRVPLTLFNNNAEWQSISWKEQGRPGARLEVGAAQTEAAERAGAKGGAWEPGGAAGGADGAGLPVTVLAPPRGPRRPSPSGPVPAAAEEAHERAQEHLARWLADHGGSRLEITLAGLGTLLQAEVRVTIDGRQRLMALHGATAGAVERLRETRAEPGRGAWTSARLQMDAADGVLHADYDWLARPRFQHPGVAPVEYANELRLFPRDSDNVPTWMAVGASAYEDVTPHPPAESPEPPSPPAGPAAAAGRPGPEGRPAGECRAPRGPRTHAAQDRGPVRHGPYLVAHRHGRRPRLRPARRRRRPGAARGGLLRRHRLPGRAPPGRALGASGAPERSLPGGVLREICARDRRHKGALPARRGSPGRGTWTPGRTPARLRRGPGWRRRAWSTASA